MDDAIDYDNLDQIMVEALPELRAAYEAEREGWEPGKPGAHIIYGDIVNPYLISLLDEGEQGELLHRIFDLLERMADSEDSRIQEVVAFTVCERLGDDKVWLAKARPYMGEATPRFSREAENFWGREAGVPAGDNRQ